MFNINEVTDILIQNISKHSLIPPPNITPTILHRLYHE